MPNKDIEVDIGATCNSHLTFTIHTFEINISSEGKRTRQTLKCNETISD